MTNLNLAIKEWPITSGETGIWLRLKGLCLKLGIARYGAKWAPCDEAAGARVEEGRRSSRADQPRGDRDSALPQQHCATEGGGKLGLYTSQHAYGITFDDYI